MDEVARRIYEISTIPQIALRVMEVANDPKSGAADLKAVVEGDAALSARLMRCVNSAAFGTRTRITNLQQAVAFLGLKQVRNLAMAASVGKLFRQDELIGLYRRSELWRHLVSVGICARLIAMRLNFANFEDMFLAGLLHDVGIIFEDQHVHSSFFALVRSLDESRTLPEMERRHLGFDHTELGEKIARTWGFPETVVAAIRHHHSSSVYEGDHADVVRCVEVANLICSLKGITPVGTQLVHESHGAIDGLSMNRNDLIVLAKDLDHELELNGGLFQT